MPHRNIKEPVTSRFFSWSSIQHMRHFLIAIGMISSCLIPEYAFAFRVDNPINGAVVYDVAGTLKVDTEFDNTELVSGMRFRALIDDNPVTPESYVPVFTLRNIAPGIHTLKVQIVDTQGKVLKTSKPVKFEMRRQAGP